METIDPALAVAHASTSRYTWRSRIQRIALEAVLLFGAVQAYRLVRVATEGSRDAAIQNGLAILRAERLLGIDVERGAQALVLRSGLLVDGFNAVYVLGFWSVVAATLLMLFLVDRRRFRHFRNALFLSGSAGLVVFAAFPVAPPRMLTGFVDTVHHYSSAGSVAHPGDFTNEFAAMPSFHVGWLVLAGAATMPVVSRRLLWPVLLVPSGLMSVTVVVTANHYLLDVAAGSVVALLGLAAAQRIPTFTELWDSIDRRLAVGGLSAAVARAGLSVGAGMVPFVGARAAYVAYSAGGDGGRTRAIGSRGAQHLVDDSSGRRATTLRRRAREAGVTSARTFVTTDAEQLASRRS